MHLIPAHKYISMVQISAELHCKAQGGHGDRISNGSERYRVRSRGGYGGMGTKGDRHTVGLEKHCGRRVFELHSWQDSREGAWMSFFACGILG
jgi:hypothetical protein